MTAMLMAWAALCVGFVLGAFWAGRDRDIEETHAAHSFEREEDRTHGKAA